MAGPSRNFVFGPWTQEEFDRLFGGEILDINIIAGYVVDQPLPVLTEARDLRYGYDDFTESQSVEGDEYVPKM